MADTTLPALLATGDHASRPAASAVGSGGLYSCTTHGLVYQTDGSTWATWATLGGTETFIGAKAYHSTTQAVTDSTPLVALFNSEEYDTSSFHDTGSNTGRMTVGVTGYYRLTAYVYFSVTALDTQIVQFYKNGTTLLRSQTTHDTKYDASTASAASVGILATATVALTASDYVEVRVYNFGANGTIGDATNTEQQNFFEIQFLGV